MIVDDFSGTDLVSSLGTRWQGVSDEVMGGISKARLTRDNVDGTACLRLSGGVRLENNGGFLQAALDLAADGATLDASAFRGVRLRIRGNNEQYSVHLRTPDNLRSWQSYRASFFAASHWDSIEIPFETFRPHRLETPLDTARLRRLGLVAIGRAFEADLLVAGLALYR